MPNAATTRFTTRQGQVRMDFDESRHRGTRRRIHPETGAAREN